MKKFCDVPLLRGAVAFVLPIMIVGCVPYTTYETLKNDHTRLKAANDDLVVKYNRAIQDLMRLKSVEASLEAANLKAASLKQANDTLLAKLQKFDKLTLPQQALLPEGVTVNPETNELDIRDDILFNAGEAKLKSAAAMKILDELIAMLQKERPNEIIHISGHTDSDKLDKTLKTWGTNQRLSYERAYTVFSYFKDHGIGEDRMVIHSLAYLQPRPDGDNATKEGKARNRRVAIGLGGLKM